MLKNNLETAHPLRWFWKHESKWCMEYSPRPEDYQSEGTLAIETWNHAIKTAADQLPAGETLQEAREVILALLYQRNDLSTEAQNDPQESQA